MDLMSVYIAIICYALAWISLFISTRKGRDATPIFKVALFAGIAMHAVASYSSVYSEQGIQLGFFPVASVLFLTMNILVSLSILRLPLSNLFIFLLPLSCLSLIASGLVDSRTISKSQLDAAMLAHILLSIVSYSLLTIATLQALLLNYQNSRLKAHHLKSVLGRFPPLQTMESLLFDLVRAGFALLTLSIVTGIFFIEDMFAQHLSHKTLFSIGSWLLYGTLLFGRHFLGWRGRVAVRWVIAGFALLMLAYFGSKLVLEFIVST